MKKSLNILFIEDSEDDALLLIGLLESGYRIVHQRVQAEAEMRKALESNQWDLILCDYCMPQFDAPAALRILKSTGLFIPFIIVSGTVGEETAVEALKLGANDYLLKQRLTRLLPAVERSLHDVETHRQQALFEKKILEQSRLLDKAQDAIFITTPEGKISYWNKGAERLYGWTSAEAVGRMAMELLADKNKASVVDKAFATLNERGEWSGELYDITKQGEPLTVESRWTLLLDDEGRPKSVLAINTDITEKKNLQSQIMHAQRLESIGTLTSGIAHDFNNYLTIINCAAEVRLMELPSGETSERFTLQCIHDASRRAANLTSQLLAFSRKSAMEVSSINLNVLVKGLENLVKRILGSQSKLLLDLDPEPGFIHSDPVHIEQIILNLAVNARDAMPDKGVLHISTSHRVLKAEDISLNPDAVPGPYFSLTVSDNGTGMSEETQARIFEPFFTTKGVGKGTGLGLSTVYGIVKQNQGLIRLQSTVGEGTSFEILLPEKFSDGSEESQPPREPVRRPKTIILADDNISLRGITKMFLETRGFTVLESSHAREALSHLEKDPETIDMILSDITMPGMNSSDFIEAVEKIDPGIPILFMSGNPDHAFLERYLARTGLPFLQKPFTTQSLNNKLNEVLEKLPSSKSP